MHSLSASFVLGYHGCERETGEKLLGNQPFHFSGNTYDWLGSGIYFWEANPDRALDWAKRRALRKKSKLGIDTEPFVIGAILDLGFCLDLISANGTSAVDEAYADLRGDFADSGKTIPANSGGEDLLHRKLDCMVINYLHRSREKSGHASFDSVRAVFTEGKLLYPTAGFRRKTHIQLCVRNQNNIKGVFRVPDHHFSQVVI
jgi:hypothetical protein